jgi:hypothetical protein
MFLNRKLKATATDDDGSFSTFQPCEGRSLGIALETVS